MKIGDTVEFTSAPSMDNVSKELSQALVGERATVINIDYSDGVDNRVTVELENLGLQQLIERRWKQMWFRASRMKVVAP